MVDPGLHIVLVEDLGYVRKLRLHMIGVVWLVCLGLVISFGLDLKLWEGAGSLEFEELVNF